MFLYALHVCVSVSVRPCSFDYHIKINVSPCNGKQFGINKSLNTHINSRYFDDRLLVNNVLLRVNHVMGMIFCLTLHSMLAFDDG